MIELRGKHNNAKVFTDNIDQNAIAQIIAMLNQPYMDDSRIRIMPDVHAGVGCVIGTTMTIKDKVCPNLVGVDIGCGMETVRLREKEIDLEKLDKFINAEIPSGFDIRTIPHDFSKRIDLSKLYIAARKVSVDAPYCSIGSLGGGNHFIEVDRDDEGNLYIVVHSGSRQLGGQIAGYYQRAGARALEREAKDEAVERMKIAGQYAGIEKMLKSTNFNVPKDLAYVTGPLMEQYLNDMEIAQKFAELNRQAIIYDIVNAMNLHIEDQFTTIHNYIDLQHNILRKGAVSAQCGEKILVPMNMRDGSLICSGLGNEDWNCSAPHGAGRVMSRGEAKERLNLEEFEEQMRGIYTTSVGRSTLDESPMVYKPMEDILQNIQPTVSVEKIIHPIYNFKAHSQQGPIWATQDS